MKEKHLCPCDKTRIGLTEKEVAKDIIFITTKQGGDSNRTLMVEDPGNRCTPEPVPAGQSPIG